MEYLICSIIGYCLGCLNTAYFLSKSKGFDIRDRGSGNAGASNVKINLGWKAGVMTAVIDTLKAFLAVLICKNLYPANDVIPFVAGACAIIGHIFPFYMNFKGGKGYACYIGFLLAINWKLALAMILYGVVVTLVSNYIALATISTTIIVAIYYLVMKESTVNIVILLVVSLIIIFKHRINIVRILNHEEIGLRKRG